VDRACGVLVADFKLFAISVMSRAVGSKRLSVAEKALPFSLNPFARAREGAPVDRRGFRCPARQGIRRSRCWGLSGRWGACRARSFPLTGVPGSTSTVRSCRLVFGASKASRCGRCVRTSAYAHGHDRDAFVQVHAGYFSDLGARDRHGLTLPGGSAAWAVCRSAFSV